MSDEAEAAAAGGLIDQQIRIGLNEKSESAGIQAASRVDEGTGLDPQVRSIEAIGRTVKDAI